MARTLAAEWGPLGVRVNVVMPGVIGTPKVRALPEPTLASMAGTIPLRRIDEPAEVARAIAFWQGSPPPTSTGRSCAWRASPLPGAASPSEERGRR